MMLPNQVKVLIANEPVDFRKTFDGLCGVVRESLAEDPLSPALFVFRNRRADQIRILRQRAAEALTFYQELYKIEEEGRKMSPAERCRLRQEKAVPVFEKFKEWLKLVSLAAPPKSPLGKACAYVQKRWKSLVVYLEDGMIPIDTMAVERAFRTGQMHF